MIKSFRKIIILSFLIFVFSLFVLAQTKSRSQVLNSRITTLNGAYAGNSLPRNDPFGGGMTIETFAFYFRPNGTYTDSLDEPDWQTRVDGTYKIVGDKIFIQSNTAGDDPEELEIREDRITLGYRGTALLKLNLMNSIPAVIVKNISASSSGGIGTDRVFVGVSSSNLFNFDGKGNFSNDSSGASFVSGENIAAGTARDNGGYGTYTIKDSLLTLYYRDGKVVKKSFFYSESDGDGTALINGSFYFEPDEPEKNKTAKTQVEDDSDEPTTTDKNSTKSADLIIIGSRILKLANIAHGGDKLDSLKTIRLMGKAAGFELTILADATNQKVRNEFRKNGKLMLVEQLDGENSWQWGENLKSPLTFQKRKEMKKSFTTGLFAMQTNSIRSDAFQTVEPNLKGNLKSLLVLVDGEKYGMVFDDKNRLVAELSTEDGVLQTTYSEDYRNVSGIMIPFKSKVTLGEKSIEVKYSSIEVNPIFNEKDWSIPN